MKYVIIEDQISAQELLKNLITDLFSEFNFCGFASSIRDGITLIEAQKPDIIFLDVNLDDGTSFEIIENYNAENLNIIFITAFEEFAVKAFEVSAMDYLLKPFSPKRLEESINKVVKRILNLNLKRKNEDYTDLKRSEEIKKYLIKDSKTRILINENQIIRLEADQMYCKVVIEGKNEIIYLSKPMSSIIKELTLESLFRVHDSHVINIKFLDEIIGNNNPIIKLKNQDKIPLARRRKKEFFNFIKQFYQI